MTWVCVGMITGVKGIQGLLRVRSFMSNAADFTAYGPLYSQEGESCLPLKIVSCEQDNLVVSCDTIRDRTQAEALKGHKLYLNRSLFPAIPDDEFYHIDLVGLAVKTPDGKSVGVVNTVGNFGAGDFLEISLEGSQDIATLPFSREAVPVVDIPSKTLIIDPTFLLVSSDQKISQMAGEA